MQVFWPTAVKHTWKVKIGYSLSYNFLSVINPFFTCSFYKIFYNYTSTQTKMGSTAGDILKPPSAVLGMKTLDRDAFKKEIEIPSLTIPVEKLKISLKVLKPCLLKMCHLPPVQGDGNEKKVLLHPALFDEKLLYLKEMLKKLNLENVSWTKLHLSYENFTHDSIFKAILPPDTTGNVSSFSIVGHIIHLNLKPDLMDYKYLIGQVLLDKYANVKTVVNKVQTIENEFRNFQMELLAGEQNFEVTVKENGLQYVFDFSKVFWNPRLIHEHEEIVKKANSGDYVYDVFAGVGPFAIPLAKKKCQVHANDLNPDSYKWLCHNVKLNKVDSHLKAYNLDGRDFIKTVIKQGLIDLWNEPGSCPVHIIMNLPALALEFLDAFHGLLSGYKLEDIDNMPTVYCYFFLKKDEETVDVIEKYFSTECRENLSVTPVRVVAPNKRMMRITYVIPKSVLLYGNESCSEPSAKRIKIL